MCNVQYPIKGWSEALPDCFKSQERHNINYPGSARYATDVWAGFQPRATDDSALPVASWLSICRRSLRSIPKYFLFSQTKCWLFCKKVKLTLMFSIIVAANPRNGRNIDAYYQPQLRILHLMQWKEKEKSDLKLTRVLGKFTQRKYQPLNFVWLGLCSSICVFKINNY